MIKKIKIEQLKPGIFVHDFNCGWLHHPFLRNRVKLNTDADIDRMTKSVLDNSDALVSLARIKNKDEYTYLHSLSVSALCISFGEHLQLDDKKIKSIGVGGLLHDIGKVRVPSEILNKPGPLSEKEFDIMKQHVKYGDCILRETTKIEEDSICVTAHHHERLDGTGYPDGL